MRRPDPHNVFIRDQILTALRCENGLTTKEISGFLPNWYYANIGRLLPVCPDEIWRHCKALEKQGMVFSVKSDGRMMWFYRAAAQVMDL